MASGFLKLQSSLSAKVIPCIKHSTFPSSYLNSRCRNVVSIAFNAGFAEDTVPVDKQKVVKHHEALSLKEKERGDWRKLTLEEKKALYHMSFSQPLSEIIDQPADEWKLILASTFTAMGLMTLGLYFWMSRKAEPTELFNGPISLQGGMDEGEQATIHRIKHKKSEESEE